LNRITQSSIHGSVSLPQARREGLLLRDLGAQFNYVGSELRRAMLTSSAAPRAEAELTHRRAGLADACFLHLTRKVLCKDTGVASMSASALRLHKILFYLKDLLWESIILLLPPPPSSILAYCNNIIRPFN